MNFAPVPAGTPPAQALVLRGADPDLELAPGGAYVQYLGNTQHATNGIAPNTRALPWSTVAGTISGYLFTADATVLATGFFTEVPTGAALETAFNFITQNMGGAPFTEEVFHECAEALVSSLDYANMPAELMLTPAKLIATEVPGGALGGQATLFRRSGMIQHLADAVPQRPGLYRLRPLAAMYRFAPGIFLSARRDLAGQPLTLILEQARRVAEERGIMFARVADAVPVRTAAAALSVFKSMLPSPGYELYHETGGVIDLHRRLEAFDHGATLRMATWRMTTARTSTR